MIRRQEHIRHNGGAAPLKCAVKAFGTALLFIACSQALTQAQTVYTWSQLKARFEQTNPTLRASRLDIDEARAQEITAYLRPNPELTFSVDGTQLVPEQGVWQPLSGTFETTGLGYLHERRHKRELRLLSAQQATAISTSNQADLERNLLFNLRTGFIQALQAKAVLALAKENLDYYDHVLSISRDRLKAGDIAQVDFDRLELQRVQYVSDLQTAEIDLRTAKIQLLMLLNDRTPVDQFDVNGPYDFNDQLLPLNEVQQIAADTRPDLKAAIQAAEKAQTDHKLAVANGSTDPTLSAWWTNNSSTNNPVARQTLGLSVGIPLRIFDRNQGEKQRTEIDINRNGRLQDAARAQVFSDVNSAYEQVSSNLKLLGPYKKNYLPEAVRVRDTITFSYQRGGASLLEFLSAQSDYRTVELSYLNLIGTYLQSASQLNLAAGREVVQ